MSIEQNTEQLYMVIELFRQGPEPVYERFANNGRMLPDGLVYIDSWVDTNDRATCYQLMSTRDPALMDAWIAKWDDIVDFQVIAVDRSPTAS